MPLQGHRVNPVAQLPTKEQGSQQFEFRAFHIQLHQYACIFRLEGIQPRRKVNLGEINGSEINAFAPVVDLAGGEAPLIVPFLHFCILVVECDRAVADSHRTVVDHHVFVIENMSEADVSTDVMHIWFEASIADVTTITAEHLVHQRNHFQTFWKGRAVVQEMCVDAHVCTYVQKDVLALLMRSCAAELHFCVDPGTRRDVASEDRMRRQQ